MILNTSPKIVKKVKKELNITFYLMRDLVAKYITIKKKKIQLNMHSQLLNWKVDRAGIVTVQYHLVLLHGLECNIS